MFGEAGCLTTIIPQVYAVETVNMNINQFFTFDLFAGILTSAFLLGFAPAIFALFFDTETGQPPETVEELIARYIYGTGSLLAGFAVWIGDAQMIVGLLLITLIGGGVVVFRYVSNYFQTIKRQHRMMHKNDSDLNNGS